MELVRDLAWFAAGSVCTVLYLWRRMKHKPWARYVAHSVQLDRNSSRDCHHFSVTVQQPSWFGCVLVTYRKTIYRYTSNGERLWRDELSGKAVKWQWQEDALTGILEAGIARDKETE